MSSPREFSISKPYCMRKTIAYLLAALGLTACGHPKPESVDAAAFAELADRPDVVLLDVRSASEYRQGHLAGAVNIDQGQDGFIDQAKAQLPAGQTVGVYCLRGRRGDAAARRLAAEGFRCVNLKGGINAWKAAGLPVTTDTHEVDLFKAADGKTIRFHALMHASIRIEYDGLDIEVDPVGSLGDRTVDYAAMPKADLVLVTHEHPDHYDEATLRLLVGEHTRLVTNRRCADMYGAGLAMANGDRVQLSDRIAVEAVPAYNTTEEHLQFHPKGRDNGYILTLGGTRIYIAGDTEDIPEMKQLGDIDIAFLPCNQPFTMTTGQLARAARAVKPRVLFPYHYGQTDLGAVAAQLGAEGIDVRIRHYE